MNETREDNDFKLNLYVMLILRSPSFSNKIGDARANKTFNHGLLQTGAIIESETHIILDFQSDRKYIFEMPSRKYLNPSFNGPFNHR